MKPQHLVMLLVGVLAFAAGIFLAFNAPDREPAAASQGYVLDEPRPLPSFELVNERGVTFSQDDFQGQWSLLYFGFTYCPDICPGSMAVMAQVKQALADESGIEDRYYLISVDPERDTPERLGEYVTYFDPDFHGLTGEFEQLDVLTRAAGAVYKIPETRADDDYLVAHSSTLTLIDPAGRIHAIFTSPFDPEAIASDLQRLQAAWQVVP